MLVSPTWPAPQCVALAGAVLANVLAGVLDDVGPSTGQPTHLGDRHLLEVVTLVVGLGPGGLAGLLGGDLLAQVREAGTELLHGRVDAVQGAAGAPEVEFPVERGRDRGEVAAGGLGRGRGQLLLDGGHELVRGGRVELIAHVAGK